ncbi:ATP-binding protein [Janibacter hoylei]|uniref:ATP-binding protein n=1 Tax=Janibacter hoylei TaxID=364298 RepID=UPI002237A755|nr:ATP-binding protein [Janibacter hoylei]MCW4600226.1 ATP-binding protein [Janibacter hoylei]
MLADVAYRGRAGARDLVLTGNRGVGKTVVMKQLARHAEEAGFARLAFQASSRSVLSVSLQQAIASHPHRTSKWKRPLEGLQQITGVSLGAVGVSASVSRDPGEGATVDAHNTSAMGDALAQLADVVGKERGGGVVLCIDELQMSAPDDLEALGGLLNHLNNWHPDAHVVFIAAGLPNTMDRMMGPDLEHPLVSNPSRLFLFEELEQYLDLDAATAALRPVARGHGADWTAEAVAEAHRITQGYPAHLQVLAAATWTAATSSPIDVGDVRAAATSAEAEVARMYLLPRWNRMGDLQRAYLTAVSMCAPSVETGRVSAMLGRTTRQLSSLRDELIRSGDIYSMTQGRLDLAQPLMRGFAPQHYYATVEGAEGLPSLREMSRARDAWVDGRRKPKEPLSRAEIEALSSPRKPSGKDQQAVEPPPAGPGVER